MLRLMRVFSAEMRDAMLLHGAGYLSLLLSDTVAAGCFGFVMKKGVRVLLLSGLVDREK
jgi:hypothetical protein